MSIMDKQSTEIDEKREKSSHFENNFKVLLG